MPRGAAVIPYRGKRGVVWRIKYADAADKQIMETVGAERDGVTRKHAEAELRERLVRVERKGYRRAKPITFSQWSVTWLEEGKHRRAWKPGTVKAYENAIRRLDDYFGQHRLAGIKPRDVTGFIRHVMTVPDKRTGKPLSAKFVELLVSVLHDICKGAVAEELIDRNPVTSVERPRVRPYKPRILTPQEVSRISRSFSDERARSVFLTLVMTGVRRFELQALRWRYVNLVEGTLRVAESKSEEGERSLALPRSVVDALADLYRATPFKGDDEYVFAHPTRGSALDADWFAGELRAAMTKADIEGTARPFHDLRHTALTNLAATGASPIAVMATAGHRSMNTTRKYVHLAGVVFRDDADALEARLLGDRGRTFYRSESASDDLTGSEPAFHAGADAV
jgi:integrase